MLPVMMTVGALAVLGGAIFVLKRLAGLLIGHAVLPAQSMFEKNEVSPQGIFRVQTPDNILLDTIECRPASQGNNRHIIKFLGNGMTCKDELVHMESMAEENKATVIGFDYPNVGNSTGSVRSQADLVNAGIAQVQRLLDKDVEPKDITLYGLSLGGAVATLVAAHFHEQKPAKQLYLINDRSFSTIGDTVAGMIKMPFLKKPLNFIVNLFNWNLNVVQAYKKLPEECKTLIVSKHDSVINYRHASLYQAVKPDLKKAYYATDKEKYKTMTHAYKVSNGDKVGFVHCWPLEELQAKNNQPMMGNVKKFIARS